jgi:mannosyltransferase OCH1-like enzyme
MDNQSNSCDLNFEVTNNLESNNFSFEIPNNIFQTWHTKKLPLRMFQMMKKIKKLNPGFKYYLFDDNDCRNFIQKNFDNDVLNAYDNLIPGAYKADLWRYCILYKYGGIYIDIKYHPVNNFKFFNLLKKEHWVLDNGAGGIYNALMVCKNNNEILLKAINQIVINVKNKFYGNNFLEPTGPGLLAKYFTNEEMLNFDIKHILTGQNDYDKCILFNNRKILQCYKGYLKDRDKHSKIKHYSILWQERNIYL